MASHALDQRLFEQTLSAVGEGTVAETVPTDGAKLIDGWLTVIADNNTLENVADKLNQLRGQLRLAQPDPERIRGLMMDLSDQAAQYAQSANVQEQLATKLTDVSTALRRFSSQL